MLTKRVKAALIFVPLVLGLIYLGGWVFNLFVLAILLFAAYEFQRLFDQMGYAPSFILLALGSGLLVIQRWAAAGQYTDLIFAAIILVTVLETIIQFENGQKDASLNVTINLAGIFYIGWVGAYFISLRSLPHGRGWMLTALPAAWLADMGAYFIGRRFGKHKMAPLVSPGKSWEGYAGAVSFGALSGLLLILLWRSAGLLPEQTPLWYGILMGTMVAIFTPIGDFFISLLKRTAGVKDTGNLIPGHGGILDRIDTWIWAALIGYYLVRLLGHL
jgi:phosphatidate cytidylyltransferase